MVMPLIVVTCFSLFSWYLLIIWIRNKEKASIILSFFLILFFSYGRWYEGIKGLEVSGIVIGNYKYTLILWGIIFSIPVYRTLKTSNDLSGITKFLNITAFSLIALNAILIFHWHFHSEVIDKPLLPGSKKVSNAPDIYYIILDAYTSNDILKNLYEYDNRKFLEYLSNNGFYIASKSRSNYAFTELSIASSFNFIYLDHLANPGVADNNDRMPLVKLIGKNRLSNFLKGQGYRTFAFSSGHVCSERIDVDTYLAPKLRLSHFSNVLINTTPLPLITSALQYNLHRNRILFTLEQLPEIAKMESPKFVFAHIFAPHPPFVFGEPENTSCRYSGFSFDDGKYVMPRENYIACYKEQLIFLNKKIEEAVEGIMSNSAEPPVIILQGDHGPRSMVNLNNPADTMFTEAMSILLACRFPEDLHQRLYPSITPVNVFRIFLDYYFGTDLGTLEDRSYFSTNWGYYRFIDATGKIKSENKDRL